VTPFGGVDPHLYTARFTQVVGWLWEVAITLDAKRTTNATAHGVDHVQVDHRINEEAIPILFLWLVTPDHFFHAARKKLPKFVNRIDSSSTSTPLIHPRMDIVLMSDAVVQNLTEYPRIVLAHFQGKERSLGEMSQGQVTNIGKKFIDGQQERRPKMAIILIHA
jgi:hypothetical protein